MSRWNSLNFQQALNRHDLYSVPCFFCERPSTAEIILHYDDQSYWLDFCQLCGRGWLEIIDQQANPSA
jgi:hypothetical protein